MEKSKRALAMGPLYLGFSWEYCLKLPADLSNGSFGFLLELLANAEVNAGFPFTSKAEVNADGAHGGLNPYP